MQATKEHVHSVWNWIWLRFSFRFLSNSRLIQLKFSIVTNGRSHTFMGNSFYITMNPIWSFITITPSSCVSENLTSASPPLCPSPSNMEFSKARPAIPIGRVFLHVWSPKLPFATSLYNFVSTTYYGNTLDNKFVFIKVRPKKDVNVVVTHLHIIAH